MKKNNNNNNNNTCDSHYHHFDIDVSVEKLKTYLLMCIVLCATLEKTSNAKFRLCLCFVILDDWWKKMKVYYPKLNRIQFRMKYEIG